MRFLCLLLVTRCMGLQETWRPIQTNHENGVLLQAHVLFRHGHRVPMKPYPRDPNADAALWSDGFGQLTNIGKQQAFQLGRDLRSRYGILITRKHAWRSVRTTSSDFSRTLMSAQAVLAGLLPPEGTDRWSDLDWQPAPVHTKPQSIDNILAPSSSCPRYLALLRSISNDIPTDKRAIYDYIEKHSGKKMSSPTSLANLYMCLDIERQAGLVLPEWTHTVYPEPMKSETARSFLRSVATPELAHLRVGPLLKEIFRFNENSTGEPLRLYSTHDTVLAAFLAALGIKLNVPPNFSSVISVEFWRSPGNKVRVELWWREGPTGELTLLELPGCERNCSLHRLKRILLPLLPKDWEAECEIKNEELMKKEEYRDTPSRDSERRDEVNFPRTVYVICVIMLVFGIPLYVLIKYRGRGTGTYEYM